MMFAVGWHFPMNLGQNPYKNRQTTFFNVLIFYWNTKVVCRFPRVFVLGDSVPIPFPILFLKLSRCRGEGISEENSTCRKG